MRPDRDAWFLSLAVMTSMRATCVRRKVGCVLVNARGHCIATGYNGPPSGWAHCGTLNSTCKGHTMPSGQGLDACEALHAEQNALLQCSSVKEIDTAYVTTVPCITCTKMLLNTPVKRVVALNDYPHSKETVKMFERSEKVLTLATESMRFAVAVLLSSAANEALACS